MVETHLSGEETTPFTYAPRLTVGKEQSGFSLILNEWYFVLLTGKMWSVFSPFGVAGALCTDLIANTPNCPHLFSSKNYFYVIQFIPAALIS